MQLDILAIGAHPDDVELTCSGTLAKCVRQGYKVGIVDLTAGELGTRGTKTIRQNEAREAARILGVHTRENLGMPDGNIEQNRKNLLRIIQLYRKFKPKILLIPHWHERHPDHVHTHYLCREAWFYSGLRKIETKLNGKKQEPWRPHYYFHFMQKYHFIPSFIVDISDVFDVRMNAIKAHKSQFYNPNSSEPETILSRREFLDWIETRAKFYGEMIGVRFAEPFYSVNPIGTDDIFSLKLFKG